MNDTWSTVITAAGSSRRLGGNRKKEFERVGGEPVLARTISAFTAVPDMAYIVVTVRPEDSERVERLIEELETAVTVTVAHGGATRRESVLNGLERLAACRPDYVLIHDGARPWVTEAVIQRVMEGTVEHDACIPVTSSIDALKLVRGGRCVAHPSRDEYLCVQTPQGFAFSSILSAHRAVAASEDAERNGDSRAAGSYVDDSEIYSLTGRPIATTPGDPANRKITYLHDLIEA